jgi:hypothetical protein
MQISTLKSKSNDYSITLTEEFRLGKNEKIQLKNILRKLIGSRLGSGQLGISIDFIKSFYEMVMAINIIGILLE